MTLLIDADYLIYSSCAAADKHIKWDLYTWTSYSDERDVMQIIEKQNRTLSQNCRREARYSYVF